jgi:hypothetical protein
VGVFHESRESTIYIYNIRVEVSSIVYSLYICTHKVPYKGGCISPNLEISGKTNQHELDREGWVRFNQESITQPIFDLTHIIFPWNVGVVPGGVAIRIETGFLVLQLE